MFTFLATIFLSSLLGSLHCVVMCGPLQLSCINCVHKIAEKINKREQGTPQNNDKAQKKSKLLNTYELSSQPEDVSNLDSAFTQKRLSTSHRGVTTFITTSYSLGRLTTYSALGIISGAIGYSVEKSTTLWGIQSIAGILGSSLVILIGLHQLSRRYLSNINRDDIDRVSNKQVKLSKLKTHPEYTPFNDGLKFNLLGIVREIIEQISTGLAGLIKSITPRSNSFGSVTLFTYLSGALSTLLPCAWLYSFVIIAGSTGSPRLGWLTMFSFWLGTLPIMFISSLASSLRIFTKDSSFGELILIVLASLSLALHLNGSSGAGSAHTLLTCLP